MRCYNGCPDSDLQRLWDRQDQIRAAFAKQGMSVTWFPNGEFYMAFDARHRSISGEHKSMEGVAFEVGVSI